MEPGSPASFQLPLPESAPARVRIDPTTTPELNFELGLRLAEHTEHVSTLHQYPIPTSPGSENPIVPRNQPPSQIFQPPGPGLILHHPMSVSCDRFNA
jgi:hypothetical protein